MHALLPDTVGGWLLLAALLLLTWVGANALVLVTKRRRWQRIADKVEQLEHAPDDEQRIPVTIITGFLGAGKTTLLNWILTSPEHQRRIVVVENEVGSVSVDHDLLSEATKDEDGVFLMKNGCMCCAGGGAGDDLERVLDRLLLLRDRPEMAAIDAVIIETSGLADPAPIIRTFFHADRVKARFFLDAVVTVVDAKRISSHLRGGGWGARKAEAERQVGYADTILLNKRDLLDDDEVPGVEAVLRSVNLTAPIVPCQNGRVPVESLLDQRAFSLSAVVQREPQFMEREVDHTPGVTSVSLHYASDVVLPLFQKWLRSTVDGCHEGLFRIKGVMHIHGAPRRRRMVLQGMYSEVVGEIVEGEGAADDDGGGASGAEDGGDGGAREARLVLIGQGLRAAQLRAGFVACLSDVDAADLDHGHGHDHGGDHGHDDGDSDADHHDAASGGR